VAAPITPQTIPASRSNAPRTRHTGTVLIVADVIGVVNIVAAALGFLAIAGLVVIAARPDRDRQREDEARAHYDRHGRWPDDP
jgi:hypothetical protein